MAVQLASQFKANLIIAARRSDKLSELKLKLEEEAGVKVKTIVADLSLSGDVERLITESINGQELYGAILNAGVTYYGAHTDMTEYEFQSILQTNVVSVVKITTDLVKHFEHNKREGGIMLVSSMAALFPAPYQALYSGTKAFLMNFANALSLELKNPALSLTVFVPGGIATEMTAGEKFNDLKGWLMPVKLAASEGIHALRSRKFNYVPGMMNRVGNRFMKLLPLRLIVSILGRTYQKSLLKVDR